MTRTDEDTFDISGELPVSEMLETLEYPEDYIRTNATTVSGWIMELTGHIPKEGELIQSDCFEIKIMEMNENKIVKLQLRIVRPEIPDEETPEE